MDQTLSNGCCTLLELLFLEREQHNGWGAARTRRKETRTNISKQFILAGPSVFALPWARRPARRHLRTVQECPVESRQPFHNKNIISKMCCPDAQCGAGFSAGRKAGRGECFPVWWPSATCGMTLARRASASWFDSWLRYVKQRRRCGHCSGFPVWAACVLHLDASWSAGVMENAVHTVICIWPSWLITHLIESHCVFV